jgi:hypothetical protein
VALELEVVDGLPERDNEDRGLKDVREEPLELPLEDGDEESLLVVRGLIDADVEDVSVRSIEDVGVLVVEREDVVDADGLRQVVVDVEGDRDVRGDGDCDDEADGLFESIDDGVYEEVAEIVGVLESGTRVADDDTLVSALLEELAEVVSVRDGAGLRESEVDDDVVREIKIDALDETVTLTLLSTDIDVVSDRDASGLRDTLGEKVESRLSTGLLDEDGERVELLDTRAETVVLLVAEGHDDTSGLRVGVAE